MGTHISQRYPRELEVVAEFMQLVRPMVSGLSRDQDYIINMDQFPIPFTFDSQRTLELVGYCTVHICNSTCDTKITPILVLKDVPGGGIATWDFSTYPCG